jgi:phage terminase large subunit GpA-like protein
MVQMTDAAIGRLGVFAPLPPLMTPEEILENALPVMDPPSRMSVTDAAERYIRVQAQGAWQSFDRAMTPYMVEPSDMTQSRRFKTLAFVGPSQSGKTMMLQATALHAPICDPNPVLIVHMSKSDRDKWVEEKLNPLIQNSPVIRDRLGRARDDDTFSRKRFRGMRLTIGYPTPTMLSGGTYKMVLLTDYDHHPAVLGGKDNPEGTPYRMSLQRVKSYLSRGLVLVESSPAYQVTDPSWRPRETAPHEMPPVGGGVVQIYNQGTRGRWYWECPDCREEFEPRFDRLHYDDALEPGEAGERAEMECPHCGSLIAHRHKMALNRAAQAGHGGWRHETADGRCVSIDDAEIRKTDVASYALNGAAATFASWRDLVANYEEARRKAEQLDDDTDLATVHYTEIGVPFSPRRGDDGDIGATFLRDEGHDLPRGVAPDWARFITVSVDVQGTYFAVQVTAWGDGARAQVVDRFDITQPPADAPNAEVDEDGNGRTLDPAKYIADWQVLTGLGQRVWPIEGEAFGLRAAGLSVDFQGRPGVSDNAEAFWKARKKAGQGTRWFVTRGHGGFRLASRLWLATPERKAGGGKGRSIKILNFASDQVKNTIAGMLARGSSAGGSSLILPRWMTDDGLEEFVAEERTSKGWVKKPGIVRNEGMDLSVMARVVAEQLGMLRINFDRPPGWALGGQENVHAVPLEETEDGKATDTGPAPRRVPRKLF